MATEITQDQIRDLQHEFDTVQLAKLSALHHQLLGIQWELIAQQRLHRSRFPAAMELSAGAVDRAVKTLRSAMRDIEYAVEKANERHRS